jgi:hypothetical protein
MRYRVVNFYTIEPICSLDVAQPFNYDYEAIREALDLHESVRIKDYAEDSYHAISEDETLYWMIYPDE